MEWLKDPLGVKKVGVVIEDMIAASTKLSNDYDILMTKYNELMKERNELVAAEHNHSEGVSRLAMLQKENEELRMHRMLLFLVVAVLISLYVALK